MALDARKRRAIELLASGHTQSEVAGAVGVDRVTVNRWVNQDQEFAAEYDAVQRAQSAAFVRDMKGAASRVAIRWLTLIDSDDESIALKALLAWVDKFGMLAAPAEDVSVSSDLTKRALQWMQDEQAKQTAAPQPQSTRHDDSDPSTRDDGTRD